MRMDTGGTDELLNAVAAALNQPRADYVEHLQTLWSGYGRLFRVRLGTGTAIVKWIAPPGIPRHPRGFGGTLSHERKLRSYQVERCFYEEWSDRTSTACRVPRRLVTQRLDDSLILVLEDLDVAGFPVRAGDITQSGIQTALRWLAAFHARFLGVSPEGLWPIGTYWHLDTRPRELESTHDVRLKAAAGALDSVLSGAQFQTLVHGDAKVANFCFSPDESSVAAVDFQYVGGGCGIKDVAYLLSSCLTEDELLERESGLLQYYFGYLTEYLSESDIDAALVVSEWRRLYPVAWADFARFLSGWAPEHWKLHKYTERQVDIALGLLTEKSLFAL
jgi:hypothetical protein